MKVEWGDGSDTTFTADTADTLPQKAHTYADNGTYTVTVTVAEAGGSPSDSDTFEARVANVAPTATKAFDTSVAEGSSFNLKLTDPSDPSSADTTAGFEYRFDCGSGYGGWGAADSASCPTTDNGTRNVKAEIRDKDGGSTEYTGTVTVNNVPPTFNGLTASSDNVLTGSANKVIFTTSASDVPGDPITYTWSGGDAGSSSPTPHTYKAGFSSCGDKTVTVTASDGDGGQAQMTKTVKAWNAIFQPPIKDGSVNTSAKGQVVPVKVTIGCGTTNLTTLQPVIQLLSGDATPEADSGTTVLTASVSSADTDQYMRPVDAGYIYNLRTPSAAAGTKYTIRVNPWDTLPVGSSPQQIADWNLATGMYTLLQIRK